MDHLHVPSLRLFPARTSRSSCPPAPAALLRRKGFRDVRETVAGPHDVRRGADDRDRAGRPRLAARAAHPRRRRCRRLRAARRRRRRSTSPATPTCSPRWATWAPIDVALLPIWGWGPTLGEGHLDPERAVQATGAASGPASSCRSTGARSARSACAGAGRRGSTSPSHRFRAGAPSGPAPRTACGCSSPVAASCSIRRRSPSDDRATDASPSGPAPERPAVRPRSPAPRPPGVARGHRVTVLAALTLWAAGVAARRVHIDRPQDALLAGARRRRRQRRRLAGAGRHRRAAVGADAGHRRHRARRAVRRGSCSTSCPASSRRRLLDGARRGPRAGGDHHARLVGCSRSTTTPGSTR